MQARQAINNIKLRGCNIFSAQNSSPDGSDRPASHCVVVLVTCDLSGGILCRLKSRFPARGTTWAGSGPTYCLRVGGSAALYVTKTQSLLVGGDAGVSDGVFHAKRVGSLLRVCNTQRMGQGT